MSPRRSNRAAPYNEAAERALLGAMLYRADAAVASAAEAGVTPESFYQPSHGHIAAAILAERQSGGDVDPITVAARLAADGLGDQSSVAELTSMLADAPASAATHARIVAHLQRARELIALGGELVEVGYSAADDMDARAAQLVGDLAPVKVEEQPWPTLDEAGWHGPLGEYALLASAYTEADPVGILAASLANFGSLIGKSPHMNAGNVRHGINIFVNLVGRTAKARKGSGHAGADKLLWLADPDFRQARSIGGFNSGEAIADAFTSDNGSRADVRLLCLEQEFGRFLAAAGRDGSTMSAITRQGWDGTRIETRSRASKVVIDDHHLAVIGQITAEELRAKLRPDDLYNGFVNRFLWVAVRRGELQSNGGNIPDEQARPAANAMRKAAAKARKKSLLIRDAAGEERWDEVYREIADDDPPGVLSPVISRGDAQTLRLAMLYSLADEADRVSPIHIDAAYALWRYCRASAAWIWDSATATGPKQSKLLEALTLAGPAGLTRSAIHSALHNHATGADIDALVSEMEHRGQIETITEQTGGRPRVITRLARWVP
jgi:hypothetical protein